MLPTADRCDGQPVITDSAQCGRTAVLRGSALVCAVLFCLGGWVWTYGAALLFLPFGAVGLVLLRAARRVETRCAGTPLAEPRFDRLVRYSLYAGFCLSGVSLLLTK